MNLKQWLEMDMTFKYFEIKFIIIITLLLTLLLINIWPRFRNDALEFGWYGYLILIAIISIIWIIWKKYWSRKENI